MPESVTSQGAVFFGIPAARGPLKPTIPDYSFESLTKAFKPPIVSSHLNYCIISDHGTNVKKILSIVNILAGGRDIRQSEQ
jgi:hypothetical protein